MLCFTSNENCHFSFGKTVTIPNWLLISFGTNTFRKPNHGNRRGFRRNKLQQQQQLILEIVEDFASEDKTLEIFRDFALFLHFLIFSSVFFFFLVFVHFSFYHFSSSAFLFFLFFKLFFFFFFFLFSSFLLFPCFLFFLFLYFFYVLFFPMFSFLLFFHFSFFLRFFLFPVVRGDAKTRKKSSRSSYCKKDDFFW